jgi:MFS family permease
MYFLAGIFILFTEDKGSRAVSEPQKGGRKSTHWWQLGTAIWILIGLFFLLGLIQKIELPYVALRVGQLVSQESAAYWTGIVSAFVALGAILSGIVFGWVIDRYPARKLILPLLGGAAAVMFLQGLVPSLKVFATSRTLGYFIAGAILPLLQKRLTQSISSSKRGLSFGLSNTAFSIGGILASILGGLLMANFDVQGVFIGTAVAMLVAAPFFFWGIRATGK